MKLLIEAEDRSRDAFEKAKQNTETLKRTETELWKTINDGQKAATMTGQQYFAMRQQAVQVGQQLQRAYGTQAAALQHLVQTRGSASAGRRPAHGQAATSALGAAGALPDALRQGICWPCSTEEVIRRSITESTPIRTATHAHRDGSAGRPARALSTSDINSTRSRQDRRGCREAIQKSFRGFRDARRQRRRWDGGSLLICSRK